jgi:pimeloyl-ACP methyl ester carboxylesterase
VFIAGVGEASLSIIKKACAVLFRLNAMKESQAMKQRNPPATFSPAFHTDFPEKAIRYILIHGVGQQQEDWYAEALAAFPPNVQGRVHPFYWADILNQGMASKTLRLVSQALRIALRYYTATALKQPTQHSGYALQAVIARMVIPVLERWLDYAGDVLSYATVRVKAFERLRALIHQLEGQSDGVVLLAHSLGSVLAFEFCTLLLPEGVKGLVTLGSPLDREPIKSKTLQRVGGRVSLPIPWHNVWGTLDLICCWRPWHSGEMNTFKPSSQKKAEGQGHSLEAYIQQLPQSWFETGLIL